MGSEQERRKAFSRKKGGINLSMSVKTFLGVLLIVLTLISDGFILWGFLGLMLLAVFVRAAWVS